MWSRTQRDKPHDKYTDSFIVNPFLSLAQEGDACKQWENWSPTDDEKIVRESAQGIFSDKCLCLWFPLRREGLRPKPKSRGIVASDIPPESLSTLADRWRLAELLASLRHVKRIEVEVGDAVISVDRNNAPRMTGYKLGHELTRPFGGDLGYGIACVGRERMARAEFGSDLRESTSWPRARNRKTDEEEPQKASPHGAVILLADPKSIGEISADWSVLLPVAEALGTINTKAKRKIKLLMHGCFFVDSGRKSIAGLGQDTEKATGEPQVRADWNLTLRDRVVLPLVPEVLHDALSRGLLSSEDLALTVKAFVEGGFGRLHRQALASESALARAVKNRKGSTVATWRCLPPSAELRPLPPPDERGKVALAGIVPGLADWAANRGITLICGPEALLSRKTPRWHPDELKDLISRIEPTIFSSQASTGILAEFLETCAANEKLGLPASSTVLEILKQALASERTLTAHDRIARVLEAVDLNDVVPLQPSASHRYVLRALARVVGGRVCLPEGWLAGPATTRSLKVHEALPLIEALQPLLSQDKQAEAAGAAAATLVRSLEDIDAALDDPLLREMPVIRPLDGHGSCLLSLGDLHQASRRKRLFRDNPSARGRLGRIRDALPDSRAFILPSSVVTVLDKASSSFVLSELTAEMAADMVWLPGAFGPPSARAALLKDIFTESPEVRAALRVLAAGDPKAAQSGTQLVALAQASSGLDPLIQRIIAGSKTELLVPATVTNPLQQAARHLGIKLLDGADLGTLLVRHADELEQAGLDDELAIAILGSGIDHADLKKLPVFRSQRGDWHTSADIWRDDPKWPVHQKLRGLVPRLVLPRERTALQQAERLVSPWSPKAQITFCLKQPEPSRFADLVLKALEEAPPSDMNTVRETPWLRDSIGGGWSPGHVLDLDDDIMNAAADALGSSLLPVTGLAPDLRDAGAEKILRDRKVLGSSEEMIDVLIKCTAEARPIAVFEHVSPLPWEGLRQLAKNGVDLKLPGWSLLAAMLRYHKDPSRFAEAFGNVPQDQPDLAARALCVLAEFLESKKGRDVRAVYDWAFRAVAKWPSDKRKAALAQAVVPTRDGSWRPGRDIAARGGGIAHSALLDENLCSVMPAPTGESGSATDAIGTSDSAPPPEADPKRFSIEVFQGLAAIINYAKPHVPSDLLILLIGLFGQSVDFKSLALAGLESREADIRRIWQRLNDEVFAAFCPSGLNPSLDERRERTFLILTPVAESPKTIDMETLSGELRPLPVDDIRPLGVLGNLYSGAETYNVPQGLIRRKPLKIGTPAGEAVTSKAVQELCAAVAEIMIGYRSEQQKAFEALESLGDECNKVDQTRLVSVIADLKDQFPQILGTLKPSKGTRLHKAWDNFNETMEGFPPDARECERPKAKAELWGEAKAASDDLLALIRTRIKDDGYNVRRVLFELFQNADDASLQHPPAEEARFRVESQLDRIRTLHWGRLLTHQGHSKEIGQREGYARDLANMLLLNFSDKSEDVTGRFGLGFKSVHLVAHEVRIASRWMACRIHGGMIPSEWPEGPRISEQEKRAGRPATVIDLELDMEQNGEVSVKAVVDAFRTAAPWLPAMSRKIRRIEIEGEGTWTAERVPAGASGIDIVTISGSVSRRAIALELCTKTSLFFAIDREGPAPFEPEIPRLWLMAPLEEKMKTGWLLNHMGFRVNTGRGQLNASENEIQEKFEYFGTRVGDRLVALFDLVRDNWSRLSAAIFYGESETLTGAGTFLTMIVDLFKADLTDDVAKC